MLHTTSIHNTYFYFFSYLHYSEGKSSLSVRSKAIKKRPGDPEWRWFYVEDELVTSSFLKYKKLTQEKHENKGRVFWQNRNGRIHGQPHGANWFSGDLFKTVAKTLGKDNWSEYSGHSIRRSAATSFAKSGISHFFLR